MSDSSSLAPQDIFRADLKRMVDNCRAFNSPDTARHLPNSLVHVAVVYLLSGHLFCWCAEIIFTPRASRVQVWYDCANTLEQFFTSRLEALPSVF